MDTSGRIYIDDEVPEADAARLDGFLRGRAEADAPQREEAKRKALQQETYKLGEQLAQFKAKLVEAEKLVKTERTAQES